MEKLVEKIKELERGAVGRKIRKTMAGLRKSRNKEENVFSELCFCLLTANSSAEMGLKVQHALGGKGRGFEKLDEKKLSRELRKLGYRFYNVRAHYIAEARKHRPDVWKLVRRVRNETEERKAREWLVEHVKGLGYKEASHFLRNLGFVNLAILDRHIIRTLHEKGLIPELQGTLNRKRYLEYETKLEAVCIRTGLPQGELDFYLWYLQTNKILK
jgi:N-glycosylase/DNA lyase